MNLPLNVFRPEWARIFLDSALQEALLQLPIEKGKCLNVGCGTGGRYRELLTYFEVDGVDIADHQGKFIPWRYHQCDASNLPFTDAEFDLAVAIESFEHIENNKQAILEVARTLKCGAWLVITTPTHWTWAFELGRHGPHYYSKNELIKLIKDSGLEVQSCKPCGGGVFWLANLLKSWLSPIGLRLFRTKWWWLIDKVLLPIYFISQFTDRILVFPPTNWLLVAKKYQ
jgi:SAM-dependent methyltransferase